MYKLVRGTKDHMPDLLRMGRAFYAASGYEEAGVPYDEASQKAHALDVLKRGLVVLAVVEETEEVVGMLGILITPFHLNVNVTVANEVVWWIDEPHRRSKLGAAMLAFAADYAKKKGATKHTMSTLMDSPDGVGKFLVEVLKMKPMEQALLGDL